MATVTKKELIDRLAEQEGAKRSLVKRIIQGFLDDVIAELSRNNRLEFRDFGVFECKVRAARVAQNPRPWTRSLCRRSGPSSSRWGGSCVPS